MIRTQPEQYAIGIVIGLALVTAGVFVSFSLGTALIVTGAIAVCLFGLARAGTQRGSKRL
jgi:hypothetical protein